MFSHFALLAFDFGENSGYIVAAVVIIIVLASIIPIFRKAKGPSKKTLTEHTLGILRSYTRTGLTVNDQPQIKMTLDGILPDGSTRPITVKQIIDLTSLHALQQGSVFPLAYDPETGNGAIDKEPIREKLQDLLDRYISKRNPNGLSYDERQRIKRHGREYKAILTDLRLTGQAENGCTEVTATVRIDGKDGSERVLKRTFWILDSELDNLTVGKFINISVVEDEEPWFSILQSTDKITF